MYCFRAAVLERSIGFSKSPFADRNQLACTPNMVAEWGHGTSPPPNHMTLSVAFRLQLAPYLLTLPMAGHIRDLYLQQWPLTYPSLPSDVTEAICLSDPWLLQALHGPQLPPQACEGPLSQRAAGA